MVYAGSNAQRRDDVAGLEVELMWVEGQLAATRRTLRETANDRQYTGDEAADFQEIALGLEDYGKDVAKRLEDLKDGAFERDVLKDIEGLPSTDEGGNE